MATSKEGKPIQKNADNGAATKRKTMDEIAVDLALPEPPSKRARRALKRGKSLPAKSAKGHDKDEDQDNGDGDGDGDDKKKDKKEKARSEHGVWVGNLPFTVTATELKQWLVDNSGGVITDESITRIKMPTSKDPGRDKTQKPGNRGFAYVDFVDVAPKVAAIALSETELGHRNLLIKDSKSFEGRPAKAKEPEAVEAGPDGKKQKKTTGEVDPNASRKVFVGNMSFKTTEDDVRRNFEKCGEIDWVKVATFEDTGKCKGYGWVKFREPDAAAWAVKGFVKIKEAVETEEDFREEKEEDDGGDDNESDASGKQKDQRKRFKTRKWWVNRMLGRELKLELAEDDQARYKKRFGKDAPRRQGDAEEGDRNSSSNGKSNRGRTSMPRHGEAAGDGQSGDKEARVPAERVSKPSKEASDLQVARLTGAAVKHTGTKMTFD
ncbi:hypothetical protein E4U41_005778 [Claviceps citrina]|nr:hypothetical protein E4U41_005778 [Claviceps citrina]